MGNILFSIWTAGELGHREAEEVPVAAQLIWVELGGESGMSVCKNPFLSRDLGIALNFPSHGFLIDAPSQASHGNHHVDVTPTGPWLQLVSFPFQGPLHRGMEPHPLGKTHPKQPLRDSSWDPGNRHNSSLLNRLRDLSVCGYSRL